MEGNYTSKEKSKKLIELGLDPNSADMCWGLDAETGMYNNHPYPMPWKNYTAKQYYIPCWSVSALMNVLPFPKLYKDKLDDVEVWCCEAYVESWKEFFHDSAFETQLEAVYNTTVFMLEHKYIGSAKKELKEETEKKPTKHKMVIDILKKFTQWESIPYANNFACQECGKSAIQGKDENFKVTLEKPNLIGWCETNNGFMAVLECPCCGSKFRFHPQLEHFNIDQFDFYLGAYYISNGDSIWIANAKELSDKLDKYGI